MPPNVQLWRSVPATGDTKTRLDPQAWVPRELRHNFVSLMSDAGVPLEEITRLVGHRAARVTETVYRKQLRPVITEEAETMDRIFVSEDPQTHPRAGRDMDRKSGRESRSWSHSGDLGRLEWCKGTARDLRLRWSGAVPCWWAILGLNQ